jgi:hypothetical protein
MTYLGTRGASQARAEGNFCTKNRPQMAGEGCQESNHFCHRLWNFAREGDYHRQADLVPLLHPAAQDIDLLETDRAQGPRGRR